VVRRVNGREECWGHDCLSEGVKRVSIEVGPVKGCSQVSLYGREDGRGGEGVEKAMMI